MNFDWNDLAFNSKKPINELRAIFILAPRELSVKRFTQLIKTYLPHGNIVVGIAKEAYVQGLEGQPQFRTLPLSSIEPIIKKVNSAGLKHTVSTLSYFQRDAKYVIEKLDFSKALLIRGSWKYLFHSQPLYYSFVKRKLAYETLSPFTDEQEARQYETSIHLPNLPANGLFTAEEMLKHASLAATHSFDNGFQTGVTLGRQKGKKYEFITWGFNRVVPFQTYAWHYGVTREDNFSPMHDLNQYDTIHAEVDFMIKAQKQRIDLTATTLFINLLPCPMCTRMFMVSDIAEFVYREDHSDGYGVKMLEKAGKKVTRIVR
ncbi:MAG TPA: deaminase [Candidatus Saccharimonadales bacterium]|nr:deaminase [Candidatus Saccharimonadales bacterium]